MVSSKRAGKENDDTKAGEEPGIAEQHANKRKANVKCFFNGKRPENVPLVNIPPKMNQKGVESKGHYMNDCVKNRVVSDIQREIGIATVMQCQKDRQHKNQTRCDSRKSKPIKVHRIDSSQAPITLERGASYQKPGNDEEHRDAKIAVPGD